MRANKRADHLHEANSTMGHRGVRLGVTFPEISEMQVRAILESAAELLKEGKEVFAEIMVPVVGMVSELEDQKTLSKQVYAEVCAKYKLKTIPHLYGTMIEIPRACPGSEQQGRTEGRASPGPSCFGRCLKAISELSYHRQRNALEKDR